MLSGWVGVPVKVEIAVGEVHCPRATTNSETAKIIAKVVRAHIQLTCCEAKQE